MQWGSSGDFQLCKIWLRRKLKLTLRRLFRAKLFLVHLNVIESPFTVLLVALVGLCLVASCARAVVLNARHAVIWASLGCWADCGFGDAWINPTAILAAIVSILLITRLVTIGVTWAWGRQCLWRLVRTFYDTLSCVLSFLCQGTLQVTSDSCKWIFLRGILNSMQRISSRSNDLL